MPIYEYQCQACSHHLEVLQQLSERPLRKCPECGKARLKRLISSPVFRLKGSGWYETDFKSDKDGRRNLAEGHKEESADTKPAAEAAKPADAKPAEGKPAAEAKPAENKPAVAPPAKRVSVNRKAAARAGTRKKKR